MSRLDALGMEEHDRQVAAKRAISTLIDSLQLSLHDVNEGRRPSIANLPFMVEAIRDRVLQWEAINDAIQRYLITNNVRKAS
jgi:hypothetical protein